MFLFPIVAATAVSVCLMPNPLMKALMRVMMNTITWMTMVKMSRIIIITRIMLFKIFALAWLSSSLTLIMAIRKNRRPTTI